MAMRSDTGVTASFGYKQSKKKRASHLKEGRQIPGFTISALEREPPTHGLARHRDI